MKFPATANTPDKELTAGLTLACLTQTLMQWPRKRYCMQLSRCFLLSDRNRCRWASSPQMQTRQGKSGRNEAVPAGPWGAAWGRPPPLPPPPKPPPPAPGGLGVSHRLHLSLQHTAQALLKVTMHKLSLIADNCNSSSHSSSQVKTVLSHF